jgi:hypothetical protein
MARRLFAIVQDKSYGSSHVHALNPTAVDLIGCQYEKFSSLESVCGFLSL